MNMHRYRRITFFLSSNSLPPPPKSESACTSKSTVYVQTSLSNRKHILTLSYSLPLAPWSRPSSHPFPTHYAPLPSFQYPSPLLPLLILLLPPLLPLIRNRLPPRLPPLLHRLPTHTHPIPHAHLHAPLTHLSLRS